MQTQVANSAKQGTTDTSNTDYIEVQVKLEQFDEDATDSGVIVRSVAPGSSCERAGVEPGWSLEAVDDVDVSRSSVAVVVAEIAAADDIIRLRFRSNRDSFTFGNFGFGSNAFG